MNEEEDNIHLLVEERDRFRDERDDLQNANGRLEDALERLRAERDQLQEENSLLFDQIGDAIDILGGRRR